MDGFDDVVMWGMTCFIGFLMLITIGYFILFLVRDGAKISCESYGGRYSLIEGVCYKNGEVYESNFCRF